MLSRPLKTKQLIFIQGTEIHVRREVLDRLMNNFNPEKKLSIQVAAGKVGTGKSSHQNAVLKYLLGELTSSNISNTPFTVKYTPTTLTQGVWIYPYPLYDPDHPDTQILVVDLEGMGGIKEGEQEDVELTLMKIYLFGMLISSVFTIHTENKPDDNVVKILKKAFQIHRTIRSTYDVQPPEMYLLMKDINSEQCELAIAELKRLITGHFEGYEQELTHLNIKGKESPPRSFIDSYSKDCRELPGTPYLDVIRKLVRVTATKPKFDPTSINRPIKIEAFCMFVSDICSLFNEKDFESRVSLEIDYMRYEKINQIYNKHITSCVEYFNEKANNEPTETSIEMFTEQFDTSVQDFLNAFLLEIRESVKMSRLVEKWIQKQECVFRATTKALDTKQIFINRKISVEQNKAQEEEFKAVLRAEEVKTEEAKRCSEQIQRRLDEEADRYKAEKERSQKESDARLHQLAQDLLREKERGRLEKEQFNKQLSESELKHAEDSKNWSIQFEALRREHDEINRSREEHACQIKKLEGELHNERANHTREMFETMHQQTQEKDLMFQRMMEERQKLHEQQIELFRQQIAAAHSSKKEKESGFLKIFAKPFELLATGIVELILPK